MLRKIEGIDKELRKVKQSSQAEQKRLTLVRQQVAQRREVISIIGQEMAALQSVIDSLGGEIVRLRGEERHLLEQYSRSVKAMQHRDVHADRLLFLFSSSSLDKALLRQRFLGSYATATSQATKRIKATRATIEGHQAEVNRSHEQKAELLALRDRERKNLEAEEGKRQAQVNTLKGQERRLAQSLEQQRRQAQQLESRIQAQIAAEIAAAEEQARRQREERERRRVAREASRQSSSDRQTSPTKSDTPSRSDSDKDEDDADVRKSAIRGGYAMDAEERKLSGSFSQNRGRLPSPVRGRYDLVRRFGLQQHSAHSRVQLNNGGIDLRVYTDRSAYAVFQGVVSSVFMVPGYGQSVIVRHGNYRSVYANLSNVRVGQGQRVKAGQAIGTISSSGDADRANVLHFQIWHERTKQNPEAWIRR